MASSPVLHAVLSETWHLHQNVNLITLQLYNSPVELDAKLYTFIGDIALAIPSLP